MEGVRDGAPALGRVPRQPPHCAERVDLRAGTPAQPVVLSSFCPLGPQLGHPQEVMCCYAVGWACADIGQKDMSGPCRTPVQTCIARRGFRRLHKQVEAGCNCAIPQATGLPSNRRGSACTSESMDRVTWALSFLPAWRILALP